MLHTDLPIYKKCYDLLSLAADVQLNMPRTFKQSLGKRVHDECVDLLLEIGYANASRGEKRCEHIRNVLRGLEVVSLMMRVSFDKRFISHKIWATSMELTNTIGGQAGGWVAKQAKNEGRTWPDWRTAPPDTAIEHDRSQEAPVPAIVFFPCGSLGESVDSEGGEQ